MNFSPRIGAKGIVPLTGVRCSCFGLPSISIPSVGVSACRALHPSPRLHSKSSLSTSSIGTGINAALARNSSAGVVSLYLGLPGDGKSMAGMRRLETVLAMSRERWVITNLPVEMGELQSFLIQRYSSDLECFRRVVLLDQEQCRKFWLIRGDGWRLIDLADDQWAQNKYPSLQRVFRWKPRTEETGLSRRDLSTMTMPEVVQLLDSGEIEEGDFGKLHLEADYILDECQNVYPARNYHSTPKGFPFYITQHRHLGDNFTGITQKEDQVEKVVRNLAMEFYVYKNLGQRRKMWFRLPAIFGFTMFNEPPSRQGASPQDMGTFKIDIAGLAQCYRTASGFGMGGPTMHADTKTKRSGVSWKWAILALLVFVVFLCFVPSLFSKVLMWGLFAKKKEGSVTAVTAPLPVVPAPTNSFPSSPFLSLLPPVSPNIVTQSAKSDRVFITSALKTPDRGWFLSLTDGRIIDSTELVRVQTNMSGGVAWVELYDQKRVNWVVNPPSPAIPGKK